MSDTVEIVVLVNGKLRDRIAAPAGGRTGRRPGPRQRQRQGGAKHFDGKQIVKENLVPGKLVNLVVR